MLKLVDFKRNARRNKTKPFARSVPLRFLRTGRRNKWRNSRRNFPKLYTSRKAKNLSQSETNAGKSYDRAALIHLGEDPVRTREVLSATE